MATIPPKQVGGHKPPKRWRKLVFLSLGILFLSFGLFCFAVQYPKITAPIYTIVGLACIIVASYHLYKRSRLTRLISTGKQDKNNADDSQNYSHTCSTPSHTMQRDEDIVDEIHTNSDTISNDSEPTKNSKQKNKSTNEKQPNHHVPPFGGEL